MSDRIIFTVRKNGKAIAYLFESWGMDMGPEIERQFKKCAKRDNLDVINSQEDCLLALVRAGEFLWGNGSGEFNGMTLTDHDEKFKTATKPDRKWAKDHKAFVKEHGLDVMPTHTAFFYGVGEDYVQYIFGWCEDAYDLNIESMLPNTPLDDQLIEEATKAARDYFMLRKPGLDPAHMKFTVKDNKIYFKDIYDNRHYISRKENIWAVDGEPCDSIEYGLKYYL